MDNRPPIATVRPQPPHDGPANHELLGSASLPVLTRDGATTHEPPHTFIAPTSIPRSSSANFSAIDDGGVDTNSDDIGPKHELSSEKTRMHKFYHFLCSIPVMILRRIAKEWNCRQYGLKKVLVARIFLFTMEQVYEQGRSLDDLLKTCSPMPNFNNYLADAHSRVLWDEPPSKVELLRTVGGAADDIDVSEGSDFSLSELARLLIIMRNDVSVKQSIYQSRFSSSNGDRQLSDHSLFWETIVQTKFNDESYRPSFHPPLASLDPMLVDIDPSAPPTGFRSSTELMEQFHAVRTSFRYYQGRWLKLRGGATRFIDVLPQNICIVRRMLVVFHIMGYAATAGSDDARLLGFTIGSDEHPLRRCRGQSTDPNRGIADEQVAVEEGQRRPRNATYMAARHTQYPAVVNDHRAGENDVGGGGIDDEETDVGSYARSIVRPKRRRRCKTRNEDEDNAQAIRSLVQALRAPLSDDPTSTELYRAKEEKIQIDLQLAQVQLQSAQMQLKSAQVQLQSMQAQLQSSQVQLQSSLISSIASVQRMLPEQDSDPEFKTITQILYQNMKDEIFKMRHT